MNSDQKTQLAALRQREADNAALQRSLDELNAAHKAQGETLAAEQKVRRGPVSSCIFLGIVSRCCSSLIAPRIAHKAQGEALAGEQKVRRGPTFVLFFVLLSMAYVRLVCSPH